MAKKSWSFQLDDSTHTVELDHGYYSGKRKVTLDGKVIQNTANILHVFFDIGSQFTFQINNHSGTIVIHTNGFRFTSDLVIDGKSMETGQEVKLPAPISGWIWFLIIACAMIPVISLGGIIPILIGFGGVTGCLKVVQNPRINVRQRFIFCVGITILCWLGFLILLAVTYYKTLS
jgi:hypothetical protein